jgi:hypothetical protein
MKVEHMVRFRTGCDVRLDLLDRLVGELCCATGWWSKVRVPLVIVELVISVITSIAYQLATWLKTVQNL